MLLSTPRIIMQKWLASHNAATPCGEATSDIAISGWNDASLNAKTTALRVGSAILLVDDKPAAKYAPLNLYDQRNGDLFLED